MNNLKYELNNMRKLRIPILLLTMITNIIVLAGAFCIGYFDRETNNDIFEHFNSLVGISDSLTTLIVSIFLSIKACKYIIAHYLNDNKIRLFLFPNGRKGIFINKLTAFTLVSIIEEMIGLFLINIISAMIVKLTGVLPEYINTLDLIAVMIASILFSITALIISVILGIRFSSRVVTVITSVILVVIACNLLGILCAYLPLLSLGISVMTIFIATFLMESCANYLKDDELLR